jgi:hypothetical protein
LRKEFHIFRQTPRDNFGERPFGHIAAGPLDRSPNDPLGFDHLKAKANRQRAGGSVEISRNS